MAKVCYGTRIPTIKNTKNNSSGFIVSVLLTDAAKVFSKVDDIKLPLIITITSDGNTTQWYAEVEE